MTRDPLTIATYQALVTRFGGPTITREQARELCGYASAGSLTNAITKGKFPRPMPGGLFDLAAVAEFMEKHRTQEAA